MVLDHLVVCLDVAHKNAVYYYVATPVPGFCFGATCLLAFDVLYLDSLDSSILSMVHDTAN